MTRIFSSLVAASLAHVIIGSSPAMAEEGGRSPFSVSFLAGLEALVQESHAPPLFGDEREDFTTVLPFAGLRAGWTPIRFLRLAATAQLAFLTSDESGAGKVTGTAVRLDIGIDWLFASKDQLFWVGLGVGDRIFWLQGTDNSDDWDGTETRLLGFLHAGIAWNLNEYWSIGVEGEFQKQVIAEHGFSASGVLSWSPSW